MMKNERTRYWPVRVASEADLERWMEFAKTVQGEFHDIDLSHDAHYHSAVLKNIRRSTAIFVENVSRDIIGAMMYSPDSHHIGWLAVGPAHRRQGIGSALVRFMFEQLRLDRPIEVNTFLETDASGKAACAFYQSLGFEPREIIQDEKNVNAGHPFQRFVRE